MNYSFEYIDIILLAMIAGFIFLRLRGILGKKTGHEDNMRAAFPQDFTTKKESQKIDENNFDDKAKADFLNGAKIAYESIVTSLSSGELKKIRNLLDKKVFNEFDEAVKERKNKGLISETTFVGINSADIKNYSQINNMLEVTVDFVSEIISSVEDKNKKLISGDPKKVKKVYDTWKFSRDVKSLSPNWLLIDTQAQLIKKLSDKDQKDWKQFIDSNEKLENKDVNYNKSKKNFKKKSIDLHGYTLENANKIISDFINKCYLEGVENISVITGKGSRSKNKEDPYLSTDLSILKYSVPNYIKNNSELMMKIKELDYNSVEDISKGKFNILLKKKL